MASPLGNAVQFLKDFGFFDIILPFLLIFVVVFAILEKTKIFGHDFNEKGEPTKLPKQRVNSIVAFVIALFFVAVPSVVKSIQVSLPQIALLLLIIVTFMMFLGSLASGHEPFDMTKGFWGSKFWLAFIYIVIFLAISAIFLNSFGWLDPILRYIATKWQDTLIVSLIFLLIIIGVIYSVVRTSGGKE